MSLFPAWSETVEPWRLELDVRCGAGRCRVDVRERAAPSSFGPGQAKHVASIDIEGKPAREAARQAIRLLAEHVAYLQAEAGR